jgi:predicted AlkP superfamily pyrophosphatase or phosphodiesterase
MPRTAILNVVGLTPRLIGDFTPAISAYMQRMQSTVIKPVVPAVTCSAQATYVTGKMPCEHGVVANGWYDRDYAEHRFWKQPEQLVQSPKLWDMLRAADPDFTCAKVFWWYNMHSTADYTVTPRPLYLSDGSKVFDIHTQPMGMRESLKNDLGEFPFMHFWGPSSGIESSRWIAACARWIEEKHGPKLSLVYLPHLDYNLQRVGLRMELIQDDLRQIDEVVGDLIRFYEGRGMQVILLSEYGITDVEQPVHLNRVFRAQGWLSIKDELGRETLDLGGSKVFAIADHQVAHVYLNDPSLGDKVRQVLEATPGVQQVLGQVEKSFHRLDHERSGDFIVIADKRSWFTYYYWEDDARAPDFARCVDIHRKCGYDPAELFVDPSLRFPKGKLALRLLQKKLGFRYLMDVIPLDASLVRGSHGRVPEDVLDWPILIGPMQSFQAQEPISADAVCSHLFHCAKS